MDIRPDTNDFGDLLGYCRYLSGHNYELDITDKDELEGMIDYTTALKVKLTEIESMYYVLLNRIRRSLQTRKITKIKKA